MDKDKLIELITKEVMKRIKLTMEENNRKEENHKNNKTILILENSKDLCPIVKKNLDENKILVDSIDNIKDIETYEFILIQNLSNNELINISKGYSNSDKEKAIINILLRGKNIYALEKGLEYKNYENTSPRALLEVFKGYKNNLTSFGITFTSLRDLITSIKSNKELKEVCPIEKLESKLEDKSQNNKCIRKTIDKKLISEMDIKNIEKEGIKEITISKKSIVTPLAKDFARVNNINIKIES
ncbi:TIGR02536 family ethanolamine utilization protein [Clostridium tetani]|uniref:TIGR02536 family ethanolamine utilization protein n=1 Tax=Clostridium tetani TaxID=1513 RepID=UPI0013E936A6|nr:TIGR02536 family ethanolamine utilization protein [Clostridium tetani]